MVLATWERNNAGNFVWYPLFYDCDSMLGLNNEGYMKYNAGVDFQDGEYNTSNSKLWTKLNKEENYGTEIKERYHDLRTSGILSEENIMRYYEAGVINCIGERFYNADARMKYATLSDIPMDKDGNKIESEAANVRSAYLSMCNGNRLEWTRKWIQERIVYMDSVYMYGDFMKSNVVLRSQNFTGTATIRLKTYSPQRVTIRFSDSNSANTTVTKRCTRYNDDLTATDGWYEFTGEIMNAIDNNITIVGGHNIMAIDGLQDIDIASLKLSSAPRLTTLNIQRAKSLVELEIANNYMLQEVNLSGCEKLGTDPNFQRLNLTAAKYLRTLNVSGSKLRNIDLPPDGGVLEEFNISNSHITSIVMNKQPYLQELDLVSCIYLSEVEIQNCESMRRISIPGSSINRFFLKDLPTLDEVDISSTPQLNSFSIQNCDRLRKLVMQNVAASTLKTLDLSTCLGLVDLNLRGSTISRLRFFKGFNKLQYLRASSSGLVDIQYGNDTPDGLDLTPFNLQVLETYRCRNLVKVKGINLVTSSSGTFAYCDKLKEVHGTIKLIGSGAYEFFRECPVLERFPEPGTGPGKLDLSETTSAYAMFHYGRITYDNLRKVLSKLTKCQNFVHFATHVKALEVNSSQVEQPEWQQILWPLVEARDITWMFSGANIAPFQPNDDFFSKNTKMTTMRQPFPAFKGEISENLFKPMPELESLYDFFLNSRELLLVDEGIFKHNRKLRILRSCFNGCTNLNIKRGNETGFGSTTTLLQLQNAVTDAGYCFAECRSLTGSVPGNIFRNCTNLSTADGFFVNCVGLEGELPDGIFNISSTTNPKLGNVGDFFRGCTGLTGPIKTTIWDKNNFIQEANNLFKNCSNLGTNTEVEQHIPGDFFKGKINLTSIAHMFDGCSRLEFHLMDTWFRDLRNVSRIGYLFANCSGLSGDIPAGLFKAYRADGSEVDLNIVDAEAVFANCSHLTGVIPNELFKAFKSVRSLNDFFRNCWRIQGTIPAREDVYEETATWDEDLQDWIINRVLVSTKMGLLDNCKELLSCNCMFYLCSGIGKTPLELTEDDPYCIPKNLFKYCTKLRECKQMFWLYAPGTDGSRPVNRLNGEIPPTLFVGLTSLNNTSQMFAHQGGITGAVPTRLFVSQDRNLANTYGMFEYTGLTEYNNCFIPSKHTGLSDIRRMFYGCNKMVGTAKPTINTMHYVVNHGEMFTGCTKLTDYENDWMIGWK